MKKICTTFTLSTMSHTKYLGLNPDLCGVKQKSYCLRYGIATDMTQNYNLNSETSM